MKLVFLSTNFRPVVGGVAEMAHHVCAALAARGHAVTVVTDHAPGPCPGDRDAPYEVLRVFDPCPYTTTRSPRKFLSVYAWRHLARRQVLASMRDLRPDVLLAGNYHSILTPVVLREVRVPYYLILHGGDLRMALGSPLPLRRVSLRRTIRGSRWVFCNSSYTRSLVERLLPEAGEKASAVGCGYPVDKIPDTIDRAAARRALGWDDAPVVLTVARLVSNKGVDVVLRAMSHVARECPGARYVVAGSGGARASLEALAAELDLEDCVEFRGYVSEEEKSLLYQAADLFVMASRPGYRNEIEGFGITFLEANAHGLAVVGTWVGGIPDAVEDGVNGLLVAPDDPEALVRAIGALLSDPTRCRAMAETGRRRIREKFNWARIAEAMESRLLVAESASPTKVVDRNYHTRRP